MHSSIMHTMCAIFVLMQLVCRIHALGKSCLFYLCQPNFLRFNCGVQFDNTTVTALSPANELGPVTGALAPVTATKFERVTLPANAYLPAVPGPCRRSAAERGRASREGASERLRSCSQPQCIFIKARTIAEPWPAACKGTCCRSNHSKGSMRDARVLSL